MTSILIVDDEKAFLNSMVSKLTIDGYDNLTPVAEPALVPDLVDKNDFDVAFLDIAMPGLNGLQLLEMIKQSSPKTECIMITAMDDIPMVVKAVRLGALDYLVKPVTPIQMICALDKALEHKHMYNLIQVHQEEEPFLILQNENAFTDVITGDDRMFQLLQESELHARSDIPVLITGETGTGKELLAKAIHQASMRNKKSFLAINIPSISYDLFESSFCGHIRGAFTGADRHVKGYLAQAEGGTLFLDEIGDMPLEIQGKLLRILQENEYFVLGKNKPQKANVRFIAATNHNLTEKVKKGLFRKDLYYRLRYACLHLPPLRERKGDIRILAAYFLKNSNKPGISLSAEAGTQLLGHDWPGNVRELKSVLEAAVNLTDSAKILPQHLKLIPDNPVNSASRHIPNKKIHIEPLAEIERKYIIDVFNQLDQNKTQTASVLGIGLKTLQRRLKSYGC